MMNCIQDVRIFHKSRDDDESHLLPRGLVVTWLSGYPAMYVCTIVIGDVLSSGVFVMIKLSELSRELDCSASKRQSPNHTTHC